MPEAETRTGGGGRHLRQRLRLLLVAWGAGMLLVGPSCPSAPGPPTSRAVPEGPALTLFFMGNELGALKPCGCSGGQLGGLEKRAALFDRVPASNRLLVETGALVEGDGEQDLIKFGILFEALRQLNYDVLCLTDHDFEVAERLGLLTDPARAPAVIRASGEGLPQTFTKRFVVRGREMDVRVTAFDSRDPAAESGTDASSVATVDVLILPHSDPNFLRAMAMQRPGVDCVICPSEAEEPRLVSAPGARPLVFTVGRFGRYACRVDVTAVGPKGEPVLRFERVPLEAGLPRDEAMARLYRQYQQLVKDAGLLEKYPRVPLPEGLGFVGSHICQRCHEHAFERWSTQPHASAFAALKRVGSDQDPECAVCHVVGMDYESGFVSEAKTPHLTGVGCETCHGPGFKHVNALGEEPLAPPKTACRDCHTPERSTGYAGHEEEFMQKIVHWKEPAASRSVQEK